MPWQQVVYQPAGCSQLELRSLAMADAIPEHTLLKKPHLNSTVVRGTDCRVSVMSGVCH